MGKRSAVWNFFTKSETKLICNTCKLEVKSSQNTTNMIAHLENHHPDIYLVNFTDVTKKQTRIDTAVKKIISTQSGDLKANIDYALIWWIIDDCRPFSITESEGFKGFVKILNANYSVPGRYMITEKIKRLYQKKKDLVIQHLKLFHSFTITTDLWTDTLNTRSYIGITLHYIDDYVPMKICLAAKEFPINHTAINISQSIKDTLNDFEIEHADIFASITDSAANVVLAMKDISPIHIGCVAHKINLIVTESLEFSPGVMNLISKLRSIVGYFKHSNKASQALVDEQSKDGCEPLKLKQDVPTRWNSTFIMVDRYLKLRDYVTLSLRKNNEEYRDISYHELKSLLEFKLLLKPFDQMTTDIIGENYVTLSRVIPLVTMINDLVGKIMVTSEMGEVLKRKLLDNLKKRFSGIEKNKTFAYATLLDPRFKTIDFSDAGDCRLMVAKLNTELQNVELTQRPVNLNNSESSLWSLHNNLMANTSDSNYHSSLQHYLDLKNLDLSEDPLEFWKKYKDNFHQLHNIALKYLNIQASSVPCERLFSKTRVIISEKRNRIKPENVNIICFLQSLPQMFR